MIKFQQAPLYKMAGMIASKTQGKWRSCPCITQENPLYCFLCVTRTFNLVCRVPLPLTQLLDYFRKGGC